MIERILGGNPLAVVLRLIIISIITGVVLKAAGYDPLDLLDVIPQIIRGIYEFGHEWIDTLFQYFLLGAMIVIPIWLIIRFLKILGGK